MPNLSRTKRKEAPPLTYGVFRCASCSFEWAERIPPLWLDYWPACDACNRRPLVEQVFIGPARVELKMLLKDRDVFPFLMSLKEERRKRARNN